MLSRSSRMLRFWAARRARLRRFAAKAQATHDLGCVCVVLCFAKGRLQEPVDFTLLIRSIVKNALGETIPQLFRPSSNKETIIFHVLVSTGSKKKRKTQLIRRVPHGCERAPQ